MINCRFILFSASFLAGLFGSQWSGFAKTSSEIVFSENFDSNVLESGHIWKVLRGEAAVEKSDGVDGLTLWSDTDEPTEVLLQLPNERDKSFTVEFCLTPASDVGLGRFEILFADHDATKKYPVLLAADPNYFGDASGFWDGLKTGAAGEALDPGTTHFVQIVFNYTNGSSTLFVDGAVVLEQPDFENKTNLMSIQSIQFSVYGKGKWRVGRLVVRDGIDSKESSKIAMSEIKRGQGVREARGKLDKLVESIKQIDRVPPGVTPVINPDNLTWIDATLEQCLKRGYQRQARFWELRKSISEEKLRILNLQRKILEAQVNGLAADAKRQKELSIAEKSEASQSLLPEERLQVEEDYNRVEQILTKVNIEFSWHRVKLQLLRDLVNRCERAAFYDSEASSGKGSVDCKLVSGSSSVLKNEVEAILQMDRDWSANFGDCFFNAKELKFYRKGVTPGAQIIQKAEGLVTQLANLEQMRSQLEVRVLALLNTINPDGKFKDLGIPYRTGDIKLASNGAPSELIFSTLSFGYPGASAAVHEPLCADVLDIEFFGIKMNSRDEVTPIAPQKLEEAARLAKEEKYFFKQPLIINSYFRPSPFRNEKFLPETEQKDSELFLL